MLDDYSPDHETEDPRACHHRRQCSCGTWDSLHEGFCELITGVCEDCRERELEDREDDLVPLPDEPDPWADHVKDLTVDEIDDLVSQGIPELETVCG